MLPMEPGVERRQLRFKEAVLANFHFLESYGFTLVNAEVTLVRFESSSVFVNIYHGRASFEIGVEIGLLTDPHNFVSVPLVIAWAGAEQAEGFGHHVMFQVSNRKDVQDFVPKVARLVERYATPFLTGDMKAYQSAHEIQSKRSAEYIKQINFSPIREKAEMAWHRRDYSQV